MTDREAVTTPWRRDASRIEAGLAAWAREWRGAATKLTDVRMPGSGMANDTVLFRLDGDALVARLAPAADSFYPTFPTFDLDLQKRAMDLVRARTEVPAPEVVHLEASTEWLDVPFMVVRAIEGEVASDNPPYLMDPSGWFLRGTPDDWQRLETSTIDVFVQLHCIVDGVDTEFLRVDAPGETALARLLASHRDYYEWARDGHSVAVLERAFDVLTKTLPSTERSVLLWGDGRPGNIIYRDFEPVGVLDWEMAGVGPPECDLAWATFFQRFWAAMAAPYGVPVPAMFDRAASAATYERLSGTVLDDLAWYEALAGLRFGIILMRMGLRSIAYGQLPMPDDIDELMMFPRLLEELLGEI
ncbi:MAG TPA: phosphotransferase family protein [Acidimicrobiia bacterium]|nr:phosphotransferase family protein [Acidimicrobiia bacterium]